MKVALILSFAHMLDGVKCSLQACLYDISLCVRLMLSWQAHAQPVSSPASLGLQP